MGKNPHDRVGQGGKGYRRLSGPQDQSGHEGAKKNLHPSDTVKKQCMKKYIVPLHIVVWNGKVLPTKFTLKCYIFKMNSVFKRNLAYDACMSLPVYHQNSQQMLQMEVKEYAKTMPICN